MRTLFTFSFCIYRYLNNFTKLVDAIHIFTSNCITVDLFEKGRALLDEFVDEFEDLYGGINMVFNIHLLQHIAMCVKKNGPLCCYTAYNMENNIGHLVSAIHGTNDVTKQCIQKYILEKNLLAKLESSVIARSYYKKIESKLTAIRPLKSSKLTTNEKDLIQNAIAEYPIDEFESIWVGKDFYRAEEREDLVKRRKTYDSFILTTGGLFGHN